ncbi:MAG TPA: Wzz/FepE/Etk N-terminal domain-containing protein [Thermoanaerobaculia bacterium]|nr:Wzz/FepE/Etk N-terminal domain-containing protein [Thermoanaerobaculia bacterium]
MMNLTPSDLLRAVWRRRWWFTLPALIGLIAGYAIYRSLPPVYRASTLVMVERQKVPADYVKPTVTTSMQERLDTIEHQILNRNNLERIVQEMDLYPHLRDEASLDELIAQVRSDITIKHQNETFRVYFEGGDPVKVADTANRIADLFIQENLRLRAHQAHGTSTFLETELADTKAKLEMQEARIAAFKQRYMGALPEERDTNLRASEQLSARLQINMDALDKAETRKLLLQREIASLSYASEPEVPVLAPLPNLPPAPRRSEQLRAQLIELRSRYTDRHPDVIRAQAELERVEELERQAEREEQQRIEVADASPRPPARRRRVDPMLQTQLDATELEIRSLHAERERIQASMAGLEGRLNNIPRVEQELLSLTRDYDNIRRSYDNLLAKRTEARLAENLEKSRQSEQFTVLEKAVPPSAPHGPNLILLLAMGLAGGGLIGVVAALLREQTDTTYTDADELQKDFPGVPVLATIPVFESSGGFPAHSKVRMRKR